MNMKSVRFLLSIVLMSLPTLAFTQSDIHKHGSGSSTQPDAQNTGAPKTTAPTSEAQVSFDTLKTLAGEWEGTVKTDLPGIDPMANTRMHTTMRVTSRGNVLVHEFQEAGTPLDPAKYDHPVTMMYLDADRLNLVHYCDAGNRPHMTGKMSPDGKKVEFDFADLSGSNKHGHMHHAIFTLVDSNHHIEDWTYMMPGDKPVQAHFELTRIATIAAK
jgi:hypothetical protein